ncbi:unnamed protein product [Trichogramma brassicae]|uniref:Uncharacterized protein n=1 Tax=Trichogramma brassicae TaxID=86971 RepID=A0A6H5IH61_9HYME|nr:unnamed protein product [Trichogramma brassicae]
MNYIDETGLTHFHAAVQFGCDDVVEKFLELGQDPNLPVTKTGDSPLHLAVMFYRKKIAEMLLRSGAKPTVINKKRLTPLHIFCSGQRDDVDFVKMMFELSNTEYLPGLVPFLLKSAVSNGLVNVTKLLLRQCADPNFNTRLLEYDFNNWINESNPVRIFTKFDDDLSEIVSEILDRQQWKLLHAALRSGNKQEVASLARSRRVNPNLADMEERQFCTSFARKKATITCWRHSSRPATTSDRRNGGSTAEKRSDPNLTNAEGMTALHFLCEYIDLDWYGLDRFAELFFKICDDNRQFVQIDARDNLGRTPLQWAVANLKPRTVNAFVDRGAEMSRFVFPTEDYYGDEFYPSINYCELKMASWILLTIDILENAGYELDSSDALTIVKFFARHRSFDEPVDLENRRYDDEEVVNATRKKMIIPNLSLYDLIRMRPEEAEKDPLI